MPKTNIFPTVALFLYIQVSGSIDYEDYNVNMMYTPNTYFLTPPRALV